MDEALYKQFVELSASGRKVQASERVRRFIASFESFQEKQAWARAFLQRGEFGHKIRHEIYREIIFPVLEHGFHRGDFECAWWLARTSRNLAADRALQPTAPCTSASAWARWRFSSVPSPRDLKTRS